MTKIIVEADTVEVTASRYRWVLDRASDRFRIQDAAGRVILTAPAQPAIVTCDRAGIATTVSGRLTDVEVAGDVVVLSYSDTDTNTDGRRAAGATLQVEWRFDDTGAWTEPLRYTGLDGSDVVAVHYFSDLDHWADAPDTDDEPRARPQLQCSHLVQPGRSGSPVLGAVLDLGSRIRTDTWLGRGNCFDPQRLSQQWGLPVHYLAAFNLQGHPNRPSAFTKNLSGAVCLGLADIPAADVRVVTDRANAALIFDVRSDVWGQARGTGPHLLGARLRWSFGDTYRDAIRSYYRDLLAADVVARKQISPTEAAVLATSEYNPWGAQLAHGAESDLLDQGSLEAIYRSLQDSAMRPGMFVVDDMWEQWYGLLEHSESRLPHFEEFLEKVRADGLLVGIWAAFLRCSDPARIGLGPEHLLTDRAGEPIRIVWGSGGRQHFLFDLSQPETALVVTERIRAFVRRYRPDVVKFDFGYELPGIQTSIPADPSWAGERLLYNSLRVIVDALRAENPDIVVMYYSLSPLYAEMVDLHSTDDIWQSVGEYPAEANKRTFFAGLLGELGVPTYGSGGYNWLDIEQVWFDAATAGPPGSLGSFDGDQFDSTPTPRQLAVFNGISALTRATPFARIEALDAALLGGSTGGRSASWARYEDDQLTMLALRTRPDPEGTAQAAFPGLAVASAQLVLATRTDEDLFTSTRIGVVPFAAGELTLQRTEPPEQASATLHTTGGSPRTVPLTWAGTELTVPLLVHSDGLPVEWIEICIS